MWYHLRRNYRKPWAFEVFVAKNLRDEPLADVGNNLEDKNTTQANMRELQLQWTLNNPHS